MNRRLIVPILMSALVACGGEREQTGTCPAGEVCSPQTPEGLDFIGTGTADVIDLAGPLPTAIGGTQEVQLAFGGIPEEDFDLPYTANDDTANAIVVDGTNGSVVTVRGIAAGENYLRIVDPTDGLLYDRKELSSVAVVSAAVILAGYEQPTSHPPFAFASGDLTFGIALSGAAGPEGEPPTRVIDTSATLDGIAGFDKIEWDAFSGTLTAGTYPLAITTAGVRYALPLTIVDGADAIVRGDDNDLVVPGQSNEICFDAINAGRTVIGLTWTFTASGDPAIVSVVGDVASPNCVSVSLGTSTAAPITVSATAGGASISTVFQLGASSRPVPTGARRLRPTVAGERAPR